MLYCTILHQTVLYYTAPNCTIRILHQSILYYTILYYTKTVLHYPTPNSLRLPSQLARCDDRGECSLVLAPSVGLISLAETPAAIARLSSVLNFVEFRAVFRPDNRNSLNYYVLIIEPTQTISIQLDNVPHVIN